MTLDELSKLYLNHQCPSGKVPHATVTEAQLAVNQMARVHSEKANAMHFSVYGCEHCGLLHISTTRPRPRPPVT